MTDISIKYYKAIIRSESFKPNNPQDLEDPPEVINPPGTSPPIPISTFLGLLDTPTTYLGQTLKGVRVNAGETGLEFYTVTSGGISDAPNDGLAYARKSLAWAQLSPYDLAQVGATNGQVLTWSTANSRYEPSTISGASNWTVIGSDIYRNSKIRVGSTSAPAERIDIDSDGGWLRVANGDRTGGVLLGGGIVFPYTTANAGSRSWVIVNDNSGGIYGQFAIKYSTTASGDPKIGTAAMIIDNSGNFGVNGQPFNFESFTYFDVYGKSTSASGVLRLLTSNSSQGWQGYVSGSVFISTSIGAIPWTFGTNSSERMRLTAGGNFLIGTTTDLGFKFYVAGTTAFQGNVQFQENVVTNMIFGTVTGSKIGTATTQKLAFWNKTPIIQPTNAITASAFVANTSGISNDTATYGGYTMGQIAAALINTGILA